MQTLHIARAEFLSIWYNAEGIRRNGTNLWKDCWEQSLGGLRV